MSGPRPVRAPRGTTLGAGGRQWQAAPRMPQDNVGPEIAGHPDKLVLHSGTDKAGRDRPSFDAMVRTVKTPLRRSSSDRVLVP